MEGVHIERKIIKLSFIIGYRRIGIPVKLYQGVYEVPNLLIGSVKDMRTIFMHMDSFHLLAIHISSQLGALINHKAFLALLCGKMGKCGAKQA
jgi:hypothetical protein